MTSGIFIAALFGSVVDLVDPFIGTAANGHTFPGATVPFGMVQPSPDTGNGDWGHCGGYRYEDEQVLGFSQTHLSGTGRGELGDVLLLPFAGQLYKPVSRFLSFQYLLYIPVGLSYVIQRCQL